MNYTQLVQDIEDGNESALKGLSLLREQKKIIDACIKQVDPIALDEAEKYGEKTFEYQGFSFQLKIGAKRFNFSNSEKWSKAKASITDIESAMKEAWQASQRGSQTVDEDGVLVDIPEVTYNNDSLTIKKIT